MLHSRLRVSALILSVLTVPLLQTVNALPTPEERSRLLEQKIQQAQAQLTPSISSQESRRLSELIRILRKAQQPFLYTASSRLGGEDCQAFSIPKDLPPNYKFDRDTIITCRKIILSSGTLIRVAEGSSLYFEADAIEVIGQVTIDGNGEKGKTGDKGDSVPGIWNSQGDGDFKTALSDCRNTANHKDRGKKGKVGKDGKNGATIIMLVAPSNKRALQVFHAPGPPGDGGPGGDGMLYRNGRNFYCDGCTMNCPAGDQGDKGNSGIEGDWIIFQ